jgi:hypothetical protein
MLITARRDAMTRGYKRGLKEWLTDDSDAAFSFIGICEILALDAQADRRALIAKITMRPRALLNEDEEA